MEWMFRIEKKKLPGKQRIGEEEGIAFLEKEYGVEMVE